MVGPVVLLQLVDVVRPGFADQDCPVGIGGLAEPFQRVVDLRQLVVVLVVHVGVALLVLAGQDLVVLQVRVFEQRAHRIQTKAGNAALVPPLRGTVHRVGYRRITPVQVRLLWIEEVVIVLFGLAIPLPRRSAKRRYPVVRRLVGAFAVAPDVPVALGIVARRLRLDEPRMLVGRVIDHEVQNDPDAVLLAQLLQPVEVRQRAILRVDVFVVGDVISEVNLRRREARRNPDRIHPERVQIIQL